MGDSARITATVLGGVATGAAAIGIDPGRLFAAEGLAPQDDAASLPLARFVAMIQHGATLGGPSFGWALGTAMPLDSLGPAGEAAAAAPSLGAALRLICDCFAAVQTDSELSLTVEGDEVQLAYRILDPDIWPRDQDAALTLGLFDGLIARTCGETLRGHELCLEHPGPPPEALPEAGRCRVRLDGPFNALRFPARALDARPPGADRALWRDRAAAAAAAARGLEQERPLARRVRGALMRRLGEAPADLAAVAAGLGLSERTLRRRLAAEGHSFSHILSDCRARVALRMLADTSRTAAEIADRLGYSDATAFERAFRRWTGVTPETARRQRPPAPPV